MKRVGPYSRAKSLRSIDGRSAEARVLARVREELLAHLGSRPSATQRMLVERAAWLTLYVTQLDRKAAQTGSMTEHDSRTYLAWSNSLTRTLGALGLESAPARVPTIAEIFAAPAAA